MPGWRLGTCADTHRGHWHGGHTDVSSGIRGSVDLITRVGP